MPCPIDVEDYFQVSAMAPHPPLPTGMRASATSNATSIILQLLARHQVHATFFTLGWIAGLPQLVKRIVAQATSWPAMAEHERASDLDRAALRRT